MRAGVQPKAGSIYNEGGMKKTLLLSVLLAGMVLGFCLSSLVSGTVARASSAPDPLFDTVQSLDTKFFGRPALDSCARITASDEGGLVGHDKRRGVR